MAREDHALDMNFDFAKGREMTKEEIETRNNVVELETKEPWKRQEFVVESNLPVENDIFPKYPEIKKLGLGDSIFVPGEKTSKNFYACARRYAKSQGWKVTARRQKSGLRIWRLQ